MIPVRLWTLFRALLFMSGLTLVSYLFHRYGRAYPPDHGSLYGKIFPLSLWLALVAMSLAVSPHRLDRVRGHRGMACRGALTAFSGAWMVTGLACTRSLAAGVVEAPLRGTFDLLHMASGHVYLPVGVVALAWGSGQVARWLGAEEDRPERVGEPILGLTGD